METDKTDISAYKLAYGPEENHLICKFVYLFISKDEEFGRKYLTRYVQKQRAKCQDDVDAGNIKRNWFNCYEIKKVDVTSGVYSYHKVVISKEYNE